MRGDVLALAMTMRVVGAMNGCMNLLRCVWLCSLLINVSCASSSGSSAAAGQAAVEPRPLEPRSLEPLEPPAAEQKPSEPAVLKALAAEREPTTAAEIEAVRASLDLAALAADPSQCATGFACFLAGNAYSDGQGVVRDDLVALRLFEHGCDLGSASACLNGGVLIGSGNIGPVDYPTSLQRFAKACALDPNVGCSDVASRFVLGMGVEVNLEIASVAAVRGCRLGRSPRACHWLGRIRAQQGNNDEAAELFEYLCSIDMAQSCVALGDLLRVAHNDAQAGVFYERALPLLENGCFKDRLPIQCSHLATLYEHGWGTPRSLQGAARAWAVACSASKRYCKE
jgi:TPR repeat protein